MGTGTRNTTSPTTSKSTMAEMTIFRFADACMQVPPLEMGVDNARFEPVEPEWA